MIRQGVAICQIIAFWGALTLASTSSVPSSHSNASIFSNISSTSAYDSVLGLPPLWSEIRIEKDLYIIFEHYGPPALQQHEDEVLEALEMIQYNIRKRGSPDDTMPRSGRYRYSWVNLSIFSAHITKLPITLDQAFWAIDYLLRCTMLDGPQELFRAEVITQFRSSYMTLLFQSNYLNRWDGD